MRVWCLLVCGVLVSPNVRAECEVPEWRPVLVKGAICGTAMDVIRFRFGDTDLELHAGEDVVATAHTDTHGNFRFPVVHDGTYSFYVRGFNVPHGAVHVSRQQLKCGRPVAVTFEVGSDMCNSHVRFEGTLRIVTNVDDPDVYIDEETSGFVDLDEDKVHIWLEEGTHRITLRAPGYRLLTFRVSIRAGQTTTYTATMKRDTR